MKPNQQRFRDLLAELFQLDQSDLDFGIYRIMHVKRAEIAAYIADELLPQVQQELGVAGSGARTTLEAELAETIDNAKKAGFDPEASPKVQELRVKLKLEPDVAALEDDVLSDLYAFFRRYYNRGDFLSMPLYRKGVYAIPYEGEEVKLHWANADQYYVKSSESLRDYAFKVEGPFVGDPIRRVHFRLSSAQLERDNNKAANGQERRFIFAGVPSETAEGEVVSPDADEGEAVELVDAVEDENTESGEANQSAGEAAKPAIEIVDGELVLRFHFRPDPKKRAQADLNKLSQGAIRDALQSLAGDAEMVAYLNALQTPAPTDKNGERTLLEKHLTSYTARNTFDYFIHKDLGAFLKRELDFFLKNEVMHLDDIENEAAPRVEAYLSRLRAIRRIGGKIIAFLAQLEDFQKKLWLKKKFVTESNLCVTLDRVPPELWSQILENRAQIEEWKRLFSIQDITDNTVSTGYSEPLTRAFLEGQPHLVLDTRFFERAFHDALLQSFDDLDAQLDGLLIHGENFQALNLLQARYREQIKCIYIDPPYNTGGDGFLYKDAYQHSSWLAMMQNRLRLTRELMSLNGTLSISLDDTELANLLSLVNNMGLGFDYLNTVSIKAKPAAGASGGGEDKRLKKNLEYLVVLARSFAEFGGAFHLKENVNLFELIEEMKADNKSWKYTSVLIDKGKPVEQRVVLDGEGNEIKVTLYEGVKRTTISAVAAEKYGGEERKAYVEHFSKVFSDTNAQTSIRTRIIDEFKSLAEGQMLEASYVPRSGRDKGKRVSHFYISNTIRRVIWLSDSAALSNGTVVKRDRMGTLWSGLNWNNVSKEGDTIFSNGKKPVALVSRCINFVPDSNAVVLDFFAGSGTTGHAVINLNRNDEADGRRKYILVEMGEYFDTVLLPRLCKVIYSKDWRDGKPVSRQGSSHALRYLRLESYEDALSNLAPSLGRTPEQQTALDAMPERVREDYRLRYMLEAESHGGAALLAGEAFDQPFAMSLGVAEGGSGQTVERVVDVVETFNYLLGLRVRRVARVEGVCIVRGHDPSGARVVILWRTLGESPEADDALLRRIWREQNLAEWDGGVERVYVNGDNTLLAERPEKSAWTVDLIESEFRRLMFDTHDV